MWVWRDLNSNLDTFLAETIHSFIYTPGLSLETIWHGECAWYILALRKLKVYGEDFPGGPVVKNLPASVGNMGLTLGSGRLHTPQGN